MKMTVEQQPVHESFETIYLDPKKIRFGHEGENLIFIDGDGTYYPRVTLRRSFPLSAENTFILVRTPDVEDEHGHKAGSELGVIADMNELSEENRHEMLRELSLFYFVPKIQRIHTIREEFGFLYWSVETDRGKKDFIMRDSITGQVRQVSPGRWLIIDINQTRYEVHNFAALDSLSQELLQKHLLL